MEKSAGKHCHHHHRHCYHHVPQCPHNHCYFNNCYQNTPKPKKSIAEDEERHCTPSFFHPQLYENDCRESAVYRHEKQTASDKVMSWLKTYQGYMASQQRSQLQEYWRKLWELRTKMGKVKETFPPFPPYYAIYPSTDEDSDAGHCRIESSSSQRLSYQPNRVIYRARESTQWKYSSPSQALPKSKPSFAAPKAQLKTRRSAASTAASCSTAQPQVKRQSGGDADFFDGGNSEVDIEFDEQACSQDSLPPEQEVLLKRFYGEECMEKLLGNPTAQESRPSQHGAGGDAENEVDPGYLDFLKVTYEHRRKLREERLRSEGGNSDPPVILVVEEREERVAAPSVSTKASPTKPRSESERKAADSYKYQAIENVYEYYKVKMKTPLYTKEFDQEQEILPLRSPPSPLSSCRVYVNPNYRGSSHTESERTDAGDLSDKEAVQVESQPIGDCREADDRVTSVSDVPSQLEVSTSDTLDKAVQTWMDVDDCSILDDEQEIDLYSYEEEQEPEIDEDEAVDSGYLHFLKITYEHKMELRWKRDREKYEDFATFKQEFYEKFIGQFTDATHDIAFDE